MAPEHAETCGDPSLRAISLIASPFHLLFECNMYNETFEESNPSLAAMPVSPRVSVCMPLPTSPLIRSRVKRSLPLSYPFRSFPPRTTLRALSSHCSTIHSKICKSTRVLFFTQKIFTPNYTLIDLL